MENVTWGAKAFEQMKRLEEETPADRVAALVHTRAIGMRLTELAIIAAEARWPGFTELLDRVTERERVLAGLTGQA